MISGSPFDRSAGKAPYLAFLLLGVAFGCGQREAQPPAIAPPASPMPGVVATRTPDLPSSPAAGTATPPPLAATAAPARSGTARPPQAVTPAPNAPAKAQATPPQATAPPAAPTTAPPVPATAAPPPTTQAEKPAVTPPAVPARPAAQRPKGKVTLPAKLGAVTFDHENHAGKMKIECATCHHGTRPQKPLASEQQACRDCHTMPAAPPMKTSLQAAFHDPKAATGTCIDCHKQSVAKGTPAPVKCLECHRKK